MGCNVRWRQVNTGSISSRIQYSANVSKKNLSGENGILSTPHIKIAIYQIVTSIVIHRIKYSDNMVQQEAQNFIEVANIVK